MNSNEWHIALIQIYERLFKVEIQSKWELGQISFNQDDQGQIVTVETQKDAVKRENELTMSSAIRPLLEFIDGYRRRVAAPAGTLVRKNYSRYCDLDFIAKQLGVVQDRTYRQFYDKQQRAITLDYIDGDGQPLVFNREIGTPTQKSNQDSANKGSRGKHSQYVDS